MTFYLLFGMIDFSERPENTFETSESLLFLVWILFGRCTFSFYRQWLLLSLHAFLWKCIKWGSTFLTKSSPRSFIFLKHLGVAYMVYLFVNHCIFNSLLFLRLYLLANWRVITTGYNGFLWCGLCLTSTIHSHYIPIFIYPIQIVYWEFRQIFVTKM